MSSPLSRENFLEACSVHLSERDFSSVEGELRVLEAPDAPPSSDSFFFARYCDWERSFRNELVKLRARKLETREDAYQRVTGRADEALRAAIACFSIEDPLQAEIALERERWAAIERLSALSSFDLDFLMAYGLKLSIAARLASLDAKRGSAGYSRYYEDILKLASRNNETQILGEHA